MLSIRDHLSEPGIDKWVAELGCTHAPVPRQNIRTALQFFDIEMPRLEVPDAVGFLAAMDLSERVARVVLRPGERLLGFRTGTESAHHSRVVQLAARRGELRSSPPI